MKFAPKRPTSSTSGTGPAKKLNRGGGDDFAFHYRPRTAEEIHKRQTQTAGSREGFVAPNIPTYTSADGENRVRILPPTWDDAEHYGFELWAHYNVGAEEGAYLCPLKHRGEECAVCEARMQMEAEGADIEATKVMKPKKRVAMWIIDRAHEDKGPLLWFCPQSLDREIAIHAEDEDKAVIPLDSPDKGYDVTFLRGKNPGGYVEYTVKGVARRPSPIFDDPDEQKKVLKYISEHPVPDCVVYADSETVSNAYNGKAQPRRAAEEEEGGEAEAQAEEGGDEEALPSWDEVHAMEEQDLIELASSYELDYEGEFESMEEFQDWLCEQLEIEKPKKKPSIKPQLGKGKPKIGGGKAAAAPAASPTSAWAKKLAQFRK